ncbi:MAG: gamma-glutamylcyclotransferase [Actinomycetota bacterium]|nr:gamma-glutamylcyclotransferase [Actinomycetota bacterium]
MADVPPAVFVYGTLMPGRLRWPLVEDRVEAHAPDTVRARLYDTGAGYPALTMSPPGSTDPTAPTVEGHVLRLRPELLATTVELLDAIEGVDTGLYERVVVATDGGERVFVYTWAGPVEGFVELDRRWDLPER